MSHRLHLIVAQTLNSAVAVRGEAPWRTGHYAARFNMRTAGCVLIMCKGFWSSRLMDCKSCRSKWWVSPYPGRLCVVVTKDQRLLALRREGQEVFFVESLPHAVQLATELSEDTMPIFVIGGSSLLKRAVWLADEINLSVFQVIMPGDGYFIDLGDLNPGAWCVVDTDYDRGEPSCLHITLVRADQPAA